MTHDEMIEAVARAICSERDGQEWPDIPAPEYDRDLARAAIRVIAPAVLEEAAEEASIAWDAVNAIRAMKTRYEQ